MSGSTTPDIAPPSTTPDQAEAPVAHGPYEEHPQGPVGQSVEKVDGTEKVLGTRLYGADLIVVGTHTDSSFSHGLLRSTARKLTHTATRPLLVVPVGRD